MNRSNSVILFDLDGTLVDSAPDLAATLNHILVSAGRSPIDGHRIDSIIGDGALAMLERGFAMTGAPLAEAERCPMRQSFLEHYEHHCTDHSSLYPGCVDMLTTVKQQGFECAICTNKLHYLAERVVTGLGLDRWIDVVVGAQDGRARKPDPEILITALASLGRDTADAVMVGDSSNDIEAACALGLPAIAVTYGYGFARFDRPPAAALAHSLAELPDILDSLATASQKKKDSSA